MKNIIATLTLILISGCASTQYSNVKSTDHDIWVAISYARGHINGEKRAKIDKDVYNLITSGKIQRGWLELRNVYWERGGKALPQSVAGKTWGYGHTAIIRIETINRIIPLSPEAIGDIARHRDTDTN